MCHINSHRSSYSSIERHSCLRSRSTEASQSLKSSHRPVLRVQTSEQLLPLSPVLDRERLVAEVEEQVDEVDEAADSKPGKQEQDRVPAAREEHLTCTSDCVRSPSAMRIRFADWVLYVPMPADAYVTRYKHVAMSNDMHRVGHKCGTTGRAHKNCCSPALPGTVQHPEQQGGLL